MATWEYHIIAGYNPTHHQEIDRKTLTNTQKTLDWDTPCEVCNSPHSLQDYQDMLICSTCYKTYLTLCLGTDNPHSTHQEEDSPWDCPACQNYTQHQGPSPTPLLQVQWPKTWEPASNLTEPDLQDMITNWNKANCIPTYKDTAKDSHLPNITRQGHGPDLKRPWISHRDNPLQDRITFTSQPANPHADTIPMGKCEIYLREIDTITGTSEEGIPT